MKESALRHLVCPKCHGKLRINAVQEINGEDLRTAELVCGICPAAYPVVRGIPRFVPTDNYATNFGFEWMKHARTQYDSYTGKRVSEKRFFEETGWQRDLSDEIILEVGCGSGRFTEQAASTHAFVVSFDYSYAVDANYSSNGQQDNVLIVQADIYSMPFRTNYFDKVFCFGVLQHTPRVREAFLCLPPMIKPGGELVVDVYKRIPFHTKYLVRKLLGHTLENMSPQTLYLLTQEWIDFVWPITELISKVPRFGPIFNGLVLVPDYGQQYGLPRQILKEWAYLDAFDMLSPKFDSPQRLSDVLSWFRETDMADISVRFGYNGINGRGTKPNVR